MCSYVQQPCRPGTLDHPVTENETIDDITAGDTAPASHPHRDAAFSDVNQMIAHHETFTFGASHRTLLHPCWMASAYTVRSKGNAIALAYRLAGFFTES
jgi:hypothetical protein